MCTHLMHYCRSLAEGVDVLLRGDPHPASDLGTMFDVNDRSIGRDNFIGTHTIPAN